MIQLLLYQINWPAILDLDSVGTGPSSHPIPLPFRGNLFFRDLSEISRGGRSGGDFQLSAENKMTLPR